MRIGPTLDDQVAAARDSSPWRRIWSQFLSSGYVAASVACSIYYLSLLSPAFSNDLWWPNYSPSGYQALLIDVFNVALVTRASGDLDLSAPGAIIDKAYTAPVSTTNVWPTMWILTPYCWVDFNRSYEIALSRGRQRRCQTHFSTNGAVYMEAMLRNVVWDEYMHSFGGENGMFTVSIQQWIERSEDGRRWLHATSMVRASTSVIDEVAHWTAHGIAKFEVQWLNYWQTGISETIQIHNALGMAQDIVLKNIPRTDETWTSFVLYWMPINDLNTMMQANRSLVHAADNSFLNDPPVDVEVFLGVERVNGSYPAQIGAFRSAVGPFAVVDAFYVPIPIALTALYQAFELRLETELAATAAIWTLFNGMADLDMYSPPPPWLDRNWTCYGGNPLCLAGEPQSYVQQSFNFYDLCTTQAPLTTALTKYSMAFAAAATGSRPHLLSSLCDSHLDQIECRQAMVKVGEFTHALGNISTAMAAQTKAAADAVRGLDASVMQYVSDADASNWTIMRHGLLDDALWAFFGWAMVYDWVQGKREVVSFQGDVSTLVLISSPDSPHEFTTTANLTRSASRVIYLLAAYASVMVVVVAVMCVVCAASGRVSVHAPNLLWFNRIVGFVWVGRPVMFMRGLTAILLLSTAQLVIVETHGTSRFWIQPRHAVETMIISGEATWVAYVVNDVLNVVTHDLTKLFCPLSAFLAWAAVVALEVAAPVQPRAELNRVCSSKNFDDTVLCTCGTFAIGSLDRVYVILGLQGVACVVGLALARWIRHRTTAGRSLHVEKLARHELGVADNFFEARRPASGDVYHVDKVSCVMAGLLQFSWADARYTFDVKLWLLKEVGKSQRQTRRKSSNTHFQVFRPHASNLHSVSVPATTSTHTDLSTGSQPTAATVRYARRLQNVKAGLAVAYATGSIVSSVSYLRMTQVNLANDLFWDRFNMTGPHVFTANWFNEWLVLGRPSAQIHLDSDAIAVDGSFDDASAAMVQSVANYGAELQYTKLTSVDAAVAGLRRTNGCDAPWIFTQYCYADLARRWEMANSEKRQQRCAAMAWNGAVFLETVLRNVNFGQFEKCWGGAFASGIAHEVERTRDGGDWLTATVGRTAGAWALTVSDEVSFWRTNNVTAFAPQWQNYKRVALINSYTITNLYGLSYPMTLQYQNTSLRLAKQTSFMMYWGLANDLAAVAANGTTAVSGRSLVRSSPSFAFANLTLEVVLQQNGTLAPALAQIQVLFRAAVGPFGSIDMRLVACPKAARATVSAIFDALTRVLTASAAAARAFYQLPDPLNAFLPAPKAWVDIDFSAVGGSPFCPEVPIAGAGAISLGMVTFPSWEIQCKSYSTWIFSDSTRQTVVAAVLLAKMVGAFEADRRRACALNAQFESKCNDILHQTAAFAATHLTDSLSALDGMIDAATIAIRSLDVQLVQFGQRDGMSPVELFKVSVLDETDPDFAVFSWMYLIEWAMGRREVVAFDGDEGSMAILMEYTAPHHQQVNVAEYPINFAIYMRSAVGYITCVIIAVTSVLVVYVFASQGHIEVMNLLELQRVGAIVWVGRPLLFIRGLTAIGVLSTASLQLDFDGHLSKFHVVQNSWYKTVLAANEVTWMVAIVDDLAMPLTQGYTPYYATINSTIVWVIAACVSHWWPVRHVATVAQRCDIVQMDAQIVCTSGDVAIGQLSRLLTLLGVVVATKAVCFAVTWALLRRHGPIIHEQNKSIFVYSGANYLFESTKWVYCDVYYMDRMSAALNGILTIRWNHTMHALDIKLWRVFSVDLADATSCIPDNHVHAPAYRRALPLTVRDQS